MSYKELIIHVHINHVHINVFYTYMKCIVHVLGMYCANAQNVMYAESIVHISHRTRSTWNASTYGQCLIQDKISTSPSPTDRRAVVTPPGRRAARSSHWAIFLLNNIAITNNSTFPKIKLHYSISYCNKTKSNNLI